MTKSEAHRKMCEADRDRGRIAYRGLKDGMREATENRIMAQNRATPEYQEADERFQCYSKIVGDKGPAALARMF